MQSAMHSAHPSVAHCQTDTNRARESMIQIRGCVSSDMGVTFSDVTPMYLYNKQFYSRLLIHQGQRTAVKWATY